MTREITGRHVAAMFGAGFGVIIAVNVLLATKAVSTFPGLEVKNSYVASQTFDADRARAMTMVEQEWDNRGLGGFRGWCRTEGAAAVERFLSVPP